jgi:DMSO/TMAO reductase YedYZ molybdopterin-dependent catalytic subunit
MSTDDIRIDQVRELLREKGENVWPGGNENTANILSEHRDVSPPVADDEARRRLTSLSRRGFVTAGAAAIIGVLGWRWMPEATKTGLLQGTFELNEAVSQIFYSPRRLAAEFPPERITPQRVNGAYGVTDPIGLDDWRLRVAGLAASGDELLLTMEDIRRLPRTEMITEFKCIEGWSNITQWAGVRFSDFVAAYPPAERAGSTRNTADHVARLPRYVSLTTPDEQYFVGWDMPSILHPQTLLAYEMNGAPLAPEHGAPLRIASPTKYGIKQIKRIGRIEYSDTRPSDFWGRPENGYDWYSGL